MNRLPSPTVCTGVCVPRTRGIEPAHPDFIIVKAGSAGLIRQAIEIGSCNPIRLFRDAGYDAIDAGRDVRKISGKGIRSNDARFDPSKASSEDIMAGVAGASLLPAWMLQDATSRQD